MDERLNHAPCGYLSLTEDHTILTVNDTLLTLLGYERDVLTGCRFESLMTRSSRIFYQIYFFPLMKLNGSIEEMYLTLRSVEGIDVPILLNAVRRELHGIFVHECILLALRRRIEYEEQIVKAEKAARKAREEARSVQKDLAAKQRQLEELELKLRIKQDEANKTNEPPTR